MYRQPTFNFILCLSTDVSFACESGRFKWITALQWHSRGAQVTGDSLGWMDERAKRHHYQQHWRDLIHVSTWYLPCAIIQIVTDDEVTIGNYFPDVWNIPRRQRRISPDQWRRMFGIIYGDRSREFGRLRRKQKWLADVADISQVAPISSHQSPWSGDFR